MPKEPKKINKTSPDNYLPFERAKVLAEDIRGAIEDGALFQDVVRPEIPIAMSKAVDEFYVNPLTEERIIPTSQINSSLAEAMFSALSEALENALNSEQFINQLGLEIARIEVMRESENSISTLENMRLGE